MSMRMLSFLVLVKVIACAVCIGSGTVLADDFSGIRFAGAGATGSTPAEAFYVHYSGNPVIPGENIYAPAIVDTGDEWFVFYGGWDTFERFGRDDIYLAKTTDRTLRGAYEAHDIVLRRGIYVHVNDPAVARGPDGRWVMALTAFNAEEETDRLAIAVSEDGHNWTPGEFQDRSHEVKIPGADFESMARPSLIFNDDESRWELYFDGRRADVPDRFGQFVAYSKEEIPRNFELGGFIGLWADADFKLLPDGKYITAYRHLEDDFPWTLRYAESTDGLSFEDHGEFLRPDPLNPYDDDAISNPGWAIDSEGVVRAIMFGGSRRWIIRHSLGIAYPQVAIQPYAENIAFNHRQAEGPDSQRVYLTRGSSVDRYVVWRRSGLPTIERKLDRPAGIGETLTVALEKEGRLDVREDDLIPPLKETQPPEDFRPPEPERLPMEATASSEALAELGPDKAIDGDPTSFWSSQGWESEQGRAWIAIDLLGEKRVAAVRLQPRARGYAFPVDFSIQASPDGDRWEAVGGQRFEDYPHPGSEPQSFEFETPIETRFLRVVGTRASRDDVGGFFMQIAEFDVELACEAGSSSH